MIRDRSRFAGAVSASPPDGSFIRLRKITFQGAFRATEQLLTSATSRVLRLIEDRCQMASAIESPAIRGGSTPRCGLVSRSRLVRPLPEESMNREA